LTFEGRENLGYLRGDRKQRTRSEEREKILVLEKNFIEEMFVPLFIGAAVSF